MYWGILFVYLAYGFYFGIVKINMSVPDNDWGEFRLLPSYNFYILKRRVILS